MALPECPSCGSEDVRTLAAAYTAGTSQLSATSAYIGAKENRGVVVSGGLAQTLLAKGLRPPRKKEWTVIGWFFIWGIVALVVLGIALANDMDYDRIDQLLLPFSIAGIVLFSTISAVFNYERAKQYNDTVYAEELRIWRNSFVCERCLTVFERTGLSNYEVTPVVAERVRLTPDRRYLSGTVPADMVKASSDGKLGRHLPRLDDQENDIALRDITTEKLHSLAIKGQVDAQLELGNRYEIGFDEDENVPEAVKWFRLAAEGGNTDAQFRLGSIYHYGAEGFPENVNEAVKWFRMAAKAGNAEAKARLGSIYYSGAEGLPENRKEGLKWLLAAIKQGCAAAERELGWCYDHGFGFEQDYSRAAEWYTKAAFKGDQLAKKYLSTLRQRSSDANQLALNAYFKESKDLEANAAQLAFEQGLSLLSGNGVEKNEERGLELIWKSAQLGYPEALSWLCEHPNTETDSDVD